MEKYLVKKAGSSRKRSKVTESGTAAGDEAGSNKTTTHEDTDEADRSCEPKRMRTSFTLQEKKGDLFAAPKTESLAHCISEDVRMGKGIAKIFKQKFGGVQELLSQGVKPGGVAILKRGPRYIYYMVTKEKYWNKPTYESLTRSLEAVAKHCHSNGVKVVSMPRIGCGLDGLKWDRVKDIIQETFKSLGVTVTVYSL